MTAFTRQPSAAALAATRQRPRVSEFVAAPVVAAARARLDPFGIDDPCLQNAGGLHQPIGSCGDVVCCHCTKVFWQ